MSTSLILGFILPSIVINLEEKVSQVQNLDQEVPNLMMVGSPLALAVACA